MKKWTIKEVIFLTIIAIFFGIIYQMWSYAYYALSITPLKPYANDLTIGVWIMAGSLSAMLLKKPGASVIGELLAAIVEMLLFSSWGIADLLSGFIQGLGTEIGFASLGYKKYNGWTLLLSSLFTTILTFAWDMIQSGYINYPITMLITLFCIRFLSISFFAGFLVNNIAKIFERSGMTK